MRTKYACITRARVWRDASKDAERDGDGTSWKHGLLDLVSRLLQVDMAPPQKQKSWISTTSCKVYIVDPELSIAGCVKKMFFYFLRMVRGFLGWRAQDSLAAAARTVQECSQTRPTGLASANLLCSAPYGQATE